MCTYTNSFISLFFFRRSHRTAMLGSLCSFTHTREHSIMDIRLSLSETVRWYWCACISVCVHLTLKPRFCFTAPFVSLFPIATFNAISFACVFFTRKRNAHTGTLCVRWLIQFMFFEIAQANKRRQCVYLCMRLWIITEA